MRLSRNGRLGVETSVILFGAITYSGAAEIERTNDRSTQSAFDACVMRTSSYLTSTRQFRGMRSSEFASCKQQAGEAALQGNRATMQRAYVNAILAVALLWLLGFVALKTSEWVADGHGA